MLARGDADASTGFELNRLTLRARGVKDEDMLIFRLADYGFKMYGNAIMAADKLIKENPQAVAAFVRASNRALIDTIANPEEAIKANKAFDSIIDPKIEAEKLRITLRSIDTDLARAEGLGALIAKDLETQVNEVAAAFNLKEKPNGSKGPWSSYLQEKYIEPGPFAFQSFRMRSA